MLWLWICFLSLDLAAACAAFAGSNPLIAMPVLFLFGSKAAKTEIDSKKPISAFGHERSSTTVSHSGRPSALICTAGGSQVAATMPMG
jgi:hypothetical protein